MGLIRDIVLDLPKPDTAEVTLIGTGGYGESCVVHLGGGGWMVVDSCTSPENGASLPLLYLKEIGVDVAKDVRIIICTHWHDDHIKGISQLFHECKSAIFSVADTLDLKKFLRLVSLDFTKYTGGKISNSSTVEFNKCVDEVKSRTASIKRASKNKILLTERLDSGLSSEVIALSPSDFAMERFDDEISTLITDFGENKVIVTFDPNCNSVVLLLKLGAHRVILGADLEVNSDEREGWLNILNNHENVFDKKSTLFKISHHGSENGYHERIWVELLEGLPVAKLTPYNRGYGLPNVEMLKKYANHTENLYITSPFISPKRPKKRDRQTEKIISLFNSSLREIKYELGIIRSRIPLGRDEPWETKIYGNALKIIG